MSCLSFKTILSHPYFCKVCDIPALVFSVQMYFVWFSFNFVHHDSCKKGLVFIAFCSKMDVSTSLIYICHRISNHHLLILPRNCVLQRTDAVSSTSWKEIPLKPVLGAVLNSIRPHCDKESKRCSFAAASQLYEGKKHIKQQTIVTHLKRLLDYHSFEF